VCRTEHKTNFQSATFIEDIFSPGLILLSAANLTMSHRQRNPFHWRIRVAPKVRAFPPGTKAMEEARSSSE